jgi:hypothetical protein
MEVGYTSSNRIHNLLLPWFHAVADICMSTFGFLLESVLALLHKVL